MLYYLEQMKEEFYPLISQKQQHIEIDINEDLLINVDAQKMARVFNNILKNAFHYSYEKTTIFIKAYQDESYTHILFENEGETIPPDKIQNIFKQFYRLDESRNSSTGGSGLGLSIAKTIVEQHQGFIKATSAKHHTVFDVMLPLHEL